MKDCRGELLGKVRKGLASDQERVAFEFHLDSCESCRKTLDVMGDFDAVGEAEPGDWQLVARMATRAAALHGARLHTPARVAHRRTWLLAVAALALTGAAVAGGVFRWARPPAEHTAHSAQEEEESSPVQTPPRTENPHRVGTPFDESAKGPEPDPTIAPKKKASATAQPEETAAKLYRAANEARREGRTDQAIRDYQRLQTRFPRSGETHASRVSLGGLLLKNGSARSALGQFDAYLAAGDGQLAAEALFGRAQALRTLGRTADEAQNLQRLVQQYPNSAYATHAQRRLLQLR